MHETNSNVINFGICYKCEPHLFPVVGQILTELTVASLAVSLQLIQTRYIAKLLKWLEFRLLNAKFVIIVNQHVLY